MYYFILHYYKINKGNLWKIERALCFKESFYYVVNIIIFSDIQIYFVILIKLISVINGTIRYFKIQRYY